MVSRKPGTQGIHFPPLHYTHPLPSLLRYRPAWRGDRNFHALLPLPPESARPTLPPSKAPERKCFVRSGHGASNKRTALRIPLLLSPTRSFPSVTATRTLGAIRSLRVYACFVGLRTLLIDFNPLKPSKPWIPAQTRQH